MVNAFMTVSGYTFWAIILAALLIDIAFLSADDNEMPALGIAVLVVLGTVLFTDAFVNVRIVTLIAALLIYLALGVLWSLKKWWTFVKDKKAAIRAEYNRKSSPKDTFDVFAKDRQPTATENKQRITGWMALWPFSFSWWVMTWPRRAFTWLYERLSTLYDRISKKIWESA